MKNDESFKHKAIGAGLAFLSVYALLIVRFLILRDPNEIGHSIGALFAAIVALSGADIKRKFLAVLVMILIATIYVEYAPLV
jgi:hypothetical protein